MWEEREIERHRSGLSGVRRSADLFGSVAASSVQWGWATATGLRIEAVQAAARQARRREPRGAAARGGLPSCCRLHRWRRSGRRPDQRLVDAAAQVRANTALLAGARGPERCRGEAAQISAVQFTPVGSAGRYLPLRLRACAAARRPRKTEAAASARKGCGAPRRGSTGAGAARGLGERAPRVGVSRAEAPAISAPLSVKLRCQCAWR
jgi:hypothetical protein